MSYRIEGLDPAVVNAAGARRIVADSDHGYFCRISLEEVRAGAAVLLAHHVSHDVETPFRFGYAIYVREAARRPARLVDRLPEMFACRTMALRAFDSAGMLRSAELAAPDVIEARIAALFDDPGTAYIDAHFPAYGCFAARIERNS